MQLEDNSHNGMRLGIYKEPSKFVQHHYIHAIVNVIVVVVIVVNIIINLFTPPTPPQSPLLSRSFSLKPSSDTSRQDPYSLPPF